MERVKLFSESTPKRYKLFSEVEVIETSAPEVLDTRKVICIDCGYETETDLDTAKLYCPVCGGTRFEVVSDQKEFSDRIKLFSNEEDLEAEFQKSFSETTDALELKLKEFSGKSLTKQEFQKEFSNYITESELCEKGFGEVIEDHINISSDAFLMSRLFSSIKISITKSLEFDPSIMNCGNKREVIDRLGESSNFPPKVITLLKTAHSIPMQEENNAWMDDSGICKDLELEFGGETKSLSEFNAIINERYPDAPENIKNLLEERGIIEVEGDQIKFK